MVGPQVVVVVVVPKVVVVVVLVEVVVGVIDVSLTATDTAVATTCPEIDPVRTLNIIVSAPSVKVSLRTDLVISAVPLLTTKLP